MTGRASFASAEPAYSLPAFDRLAPAPSPALVAARIELHSGPGDVVADLFGRGGWVARTAVDLQRRGISLESSPLTRMLAEVVLRPPDVRHLDAAFQGMAASPRGDSSLKVSIGDLFATRCATCARALVADDVVWSLEDPDGNPLDAPRPVARHYRCTVCRDQRGGTEQRQAPLDDDDLARATADVGADAMRAMLRGRFPDVTGAGSLPDELLDLHTPRQLVGLGAILERIESDLRAAPVLAALRLALLHAILPASRLATHPGRAAALRIAGGHVRAADGHAMAGAQSVARLRGRLPRRARLHPAPGRRVAGAGPGPPGRGSAQPGRGDGDRRPRPVRPVRPAVAARRLERLRANGADPAGPAGARPAADAPEPGAAGGGLPRDRLGARTRGRGHAADRRARQHLAARAVELAGRLDRARARGGRAGDGPRRPCRPAGRRRARRRSWPR